MSAANSEPTRSVGLLGATGVGVGAIVGGGILVLAGVAFQKTGPGALLAFALNGFVAVLTALSYAEMSTAFPESGGTYTFAKKVLSVRAAFAVGWTLWFAYIVAAVLYALGFAEYAAGIARQLWPLVFGGEAPAWLAGRRVVLALALSGTAAYMLALLRKATGGGQLATVGKLVVFAVLVFAGLWAIGGRPAGTVTRGLSPFLPGGGLGLVQAMGFTFIALQGFDLVAAIAGEVRRPERTVPRAMLLSLGIALLVYLPLLLIVASVGVAPGESIREISQANPETVMAVAVRNYLGPAGFWLVMIAAVLSTLSALHANLLAASRVALQMARHRTLPRVLHQLHETRQTPVMAIFASTLAVVAFLLMLSDASAAGAAASLIFLISFAFAHWTSILARRRSPRPPPFCAPAFPAVPVVGGVCCVALAVFQGFAVPAAGAITVIWLGLGVILYFGLFASRAEVLDAFAEAHDPDLIALRGRSPLVLVPVANPKSAPAMVAVANAMAPPVVGRVLLLSVMAPPDDIAPGKAPRTLQVAQQTMGEALAASLASGHAPEALMTVAALPWPEIKRVAAVHRCESLLLGMTPLDNGESTDHLEGLLNEVACDVTILRAPDGWTVDRVERILVPIGGRGDQDELRARLLGSLCRTQGRQVTFLRVMHAAASDEEVAYAQRRLQRLAEEEAPGAPRAQVLRSWQVVETVVEKARESDLVIIGLQRVQGRKRFGRVALDIANSAHCATIMISRA